MYVFNHDYLDEVKPDIYVLYYKYNMLLTEGKNRIKI